MNKQELIKQVSKQTRLTQKDCSQMLNALTEIIGGTLRNGEMVSIMGFGRFYTKKLSERNGFNPVTREKTRLPSTYVPTFKCSTVLKKTF